MEPPSFLKKIGDCEVVTGMSAKFTACVNGVPDPEYEWFRNGKRMEPSDRFIMEAEGSGLLRLIVKDTDEADVGTYRLRIFNPYGEASCEAELRYDCECDPPAAASGPPPRPRDRVPLPAVRFHRICRIFQAHRTYRSDP